MTESIKNEGESRTSSVESAEHKDIESGESPKQASEAADPTEKENEYPSGLKLGLILCSIYMAMFLVSLDRLIITTAIPQITDDFHSVTDIGWYGSAYLLMTCAFQLLYGKLYSFYNLKVVFICSVFLFEVGSAVSGAAPSSNAFIVGRAISGLGGAGILSGVGLFGAIFGLASIIGPLLGGVFTSKVTWRWCFYINLPVGAVTVAVVLFLLDVSNRETSKLPTKAKLVQLDFYGTALLVPSIICLVLALQWGGLTYLWSDGRIIALLVLFGLLLVGFILVQSFLPQTATIPPRIFKQRSVVAGFCATLCLGSQQMIFVWFQAIQGVSAIESGIRILPLTLSVVVASISSGILVRRIGYYTPFMIFGVCLMAVGAGLLNTLQLDTPEPRWIGYQIIYGFGMGCTIQAPNLAAQTVLAKKDVSIGVTLMVFGQLIGGASFVSVGQNVLNTQLMSRLSIIPGVDANAIQHSGATSLTDLPAAIKPQVLNAYNESLRCVFLVGLVLVCLTILPTLAMEWRSMKAGANNEKKAETTDEKKNDGKN